MFKKIAAISLSVAALALGGCGATDGDAGATGKPDMSKVMFLRGVFTWWDAEEEFRIKRVDGDLYMAKAELVADGQPYDFKFADAGWTSGKNCGYKGKEDEVIELGKKSKANCSSVFENFKFTPAEDGVYTFYIDFGGADPIVSVEKAK